MFTFDRNYDNLDQVAAFLPAFTAIYDELTAASGRSFAYNDDFRGRIPGIAGPSEDTAIYLLQTLRRKREQDAKVAALVAAGYEHVDRLDGTERFAHIVLYPTRQMGGEWAEFRSARLVPVEDGRPAYVLPKGKRTHGHRVSDRAVLAAR